MYRRKIFEIYVVSKNVLLLYFFRVFRVGGFVVNFIKFFFVVLLRLFIIITVFFIGLNWENVCFRSLLEIIGERFLIVRVVLCVVKRIRRGLFFKMVLFNFVFVILVNVLDFFLGGKIYFLKIIVREKFKIVVCF